MPITTVFVPPSRNSPTTFADLGDTMLGQFPTFVTQANALETNVNAKEASATASALAAAGSATAAGAIKWAAATPYYIGDARYSPIDGQTYRCISATSDSTDPSANPTKWVRVNLAPTTVYQTARSSNTILAATDMAKLFDLSGTFTQTLTAAATLGGGWWCYLRNAGNGDITIDPNASELIDGLTTYTLKPGVTVIVSCSATAFNVVVVKARTYENIAQYTASNTLVVPAGCYVMRGYAFGAGAAGTTSNSGGGGGCAYGDIAVVPGQTVTVTISAGVSTVVYGGVTLLTANAASGVTAGTASKHASVTNGGAYSGGAGTTGSQPGGASSGSPLGTGYSGGTGVGAGGGWGGVGGNGGASGGGGVGGAGASSRGGPCLPVPSTDPLLFGLTGYQPAVYGAGPGMVGVPGVGGVSSTVEGSPGGFGAGAGPGTGVVVGGVGGFGGGGGSGNGANGGAGGYGGGGGHGSTGGGAGGGAVIRVYY